MNPVQLVAEVAAVAALVGGQLYDCYTTYVGIYVQKTAVVETSTRWKKLITGNKVALLTVKPLVCLGAAGLFAAANSVHTGQAIDAVVSLGCVFAACAGGAYMGVSAGMGNAAVNKAALVKKV